MAAVINSKNSSNFNILNNQQNFFQFTSSSNQQKKKLSLPFLLKFINEILIK